MKIPIVSGIYTDNGGDIRTSYPRNMIPVAKDSGINTGYLRPAFGVDHFIESTTGVDRGGIVWDGKHYRVCGSKLIRVERDGALIEIGDVGQGADVVMHYSFDYLGINSGKKLFLLSKDEELKQVADEDLGDVYDFIWVDGYFMVTDGEFIAVTELNDPFSVNPLKYASSEFDPDPIKRVLRLRGEPYAVNRYTTETYQNVGGDLFPFQVIKGSQIEKGCVGNRAACVMGDFICLVGSGRNESVGVFALNSSGASRISTREIDQVLGEHTEEVLSGVVVETFTHESQTFLMIHLPSKTLVHDASSSQEFGQPIWFTLTSGLGESGIYRARHPVWCWNRWVVGDPKSARIGFYTDMHSKQWSESVSWEFGTGMTYNESFGAIFNQIELVSLAGRAPFGANPTVWTSFSIDGLTWSNPRYIPCGKTGERHARVVWLQQGAMQNYRIQKFGGTSDSHLTVIRLEAQVEPLYV